MLTFNNTVLFVSLAVTCMSFAWVFRLKYMKDKLFFIFIAIFIYIYCGLGGCLKDANLTYLRYYYIYIIVLGVTIRWSNIGIKFTQADDVKFSSYLERNAKFILYFYFFISILTLVFPEIILYRLISPPSPDVFANLNGKFENKNTDALSSIIDLVKNFLTPFFYWALYKYRDNISIIALLMAFDLYISYCHDSYIGRHHILVALLIIFLFKYSKLSKKKKILFVIVIMTSIPLLAYGFYQYSYLRLGAGVEIVSIDLAMELLFGQEITYPLLFDSYKNFYDSNLILNYFEWITFLPLPGFLKFGMGSIPSYRFTEVVTGLSPGDSGWYILLPGIVGEAYFFFGPVLFFLHAILLGIVIKAVYRSFCTSPSLIFVYFFYGVTLSFQLSRGGTLSVYPLIFKHYLIITIYLSIIRKRSIYKLCNYQKG